jgi:hypothetical protein
LAADGNGLVIADGLSICRGRSHGTSESGTIVPRSKTLCAQWGPAFNRRPTFASHIAACHFDIHAAMMAQAETDKKPTVVFLARFFLEGVDRR